MEENLLKVKSTREFILNLLASRYFRDKDLLLAEAVKALLTLNPDLAKEVAIETYLKRKASLWGAAEMAGLSLEEFKKLLSSRRIKIVTT